MIPSIALLSTFNVAVAFLLASFTDLASIVNSWIVSFSPIVTTKLLPFCSNVVVADGVTVPPLSSYPTTKSTALSSSARFSPSTVAVNVVCPPLIVVAVSGVIVTFVTPLLTTFTTAVSLDISSYSDVALTTNCSAVSSSATVNKPSPEIYVLTLVFPDTDHSTASVEVPVTTQSNCCVPPFKTSAVSGVTSTPIFNVSTTLYSIVHVVCSVNPSLFESLESIYTTLCFVPRVLVSKIAYLPSVVTLPNVLEILNDVPAGSASSSPASS